MAKWVRGGSPWGEESERRPDRIGAADPAIEERQPEGGEAYYVSRRCRCKHPIPVLTLWPRVRPFYQCLACGHDVRRDSTRVFAGAVPGRIAASTAVKELLL
jgi:hypothetical protein